jgi:hypothetical protein
VLTTPIDAHLPLVIALVLACAWVVRGTRWCAAVQCAVPLLFVAMMTIADERTRLLAYGVIVGAAYAVTALAAERRRPAGWLGIACPERSRRVPPPTVVLAVVGVVLLRWIPLHDVHVVKELVVLAGSIALLFAIKKPCQRRSAVKDPHATVREGGGPSTVLNPSGVSAAQDDRSVFLIAVLAVAVVTPIVPGKMAFFPFAVAVLALVTRKVPQLAVAAGLLLCAYFARYSLATIYIAAAIVFLVPLLDRVRPLAYATAVVVLALWPWSGIIARALPVVRNYEPPAGNARPVVSGLAASESMAFGVPPHVRHVVITSSGGQMARLKSGRVVGTIEATDRRGRVTRREIRIGDVADFGFTRREQFLGTRNPLPRFSPGVIRDYGANAWLWGSGRTALASAADIASLRVVAAPNLPQNAHLQIDAVEFPSR